MPRAPKIVPDPNPDLISLDEAASVIGVHPRTIRRWVASGHLTAYRFGPRLIRVDRAELTAQRALPTARRTS